MQMQAIASDVATQRGLLVTTESRAKRLNRSRCSLGADSCGPKKA